MRYCLALGVPLLLSSVHARCYTGAVKENMLGCFHVSTSAARVRVLAAKELEFGCKIAMASGELRHVVVDVDVLLR